MRLARPLAQPLAQRIARPLSGARVGGPVIEPHVLWSPTYPFDPAWEPYILAGTTWEINGDGDFQVASIADLTTLHLGSGNYQGSVDLSGAESLTYFQSYGNGLYSIDFTGCTALAQLIIGGGSMLNLDITGLTSLAVFDFRLNSIATLTFDSSNAALQVFKTYFGLDTSVLDLSPLTGLTYFRCGYAGFTGLGVSNLTYLTNLYVAQTPVGSYGINLLGASNLTSLSLNGCSLSNLSLPSSPTSLVTLSASYNYLSSFGLQGASGVLNLYLGSNSLQQSDVDGILNNLDSYGLYYGNVDLSGGFNSAPSYNSYAARQNLATKGWIVVHTPE